MVSQSVARPCASGIETSLALVNMTMMVTMMTLIVVSCNCYSFCYGWSAMPIRYGYHQRPLMIGTGMSMSSSTATTTTTSTSLFSTRRVKKTTKTTTNIKKKKQIATNTEGFVDVDFERVIVEEEEEEETQEQAVAQPVQPKQPKKKQQHQQQQASNSSTSKKSFTSSTSTTASGGDGGGTPTTKDSTTPPATTSTKTLIDISLETGDPNWNKARIPFFHPNGQNYIDCKLAFMVDIQSGDDGTKVSYGIAVPFDDAVAIVEEHPKKGNIMYFHPDDVVAARSSSSSTTDDDDDSNRSGVDSDEILELMEIMATHVQEQLGESLTLCKTPKVLTIRGEGLKELTDNWETDLLPSPATVEELLSTMSSSKPKNKKQQQKEPKTSATSKQSKDDIYQEELQEFYDFMKAELGQVEFDKTMNQELNEDDIDEELLKLFDVPGLDLLDRLDDDDENNNGSATTSEGMEEILQSMLLDIQEQTSVDETSRESKGFDPQQKNKKTQTTLEKESEFITKPTFMDGAALKLLSFNFRGGKKAYSLVKLLQPFVIVGKYVGEMTDEHIVADEDDSSDDNYDLDDYYDYEADDDDSEDESSNAQATSGDDATSQQKKKPRMIRFELLTPQEEKVVIPKLEELCRNDLEAAGLSTLKP